MVLFKKVLDLLAERGAGDILVFGGGTIPPQDVEALKKMGVKAVFTPGTPASAILSELERLLAERKSERTG